jgi:hypothetical protein
MFNKGDRVRYSELGINELRPRRLCRRGTISANLTKPGIRNISVRWDGTKSPERISLDFIELDLPETPGPAEAF